MARLFFAEADRFDVCCYHISVNRSGGLPGINTTQRVPKNNIGQFIMHLYSDRVTQPPAPFQFVSLDPGEESVPGLKRRPVN